MIAEVASENLPTFAANLLGIFIQGVSRQVSKNSLKSGIGGRITKSSNVVILIAKSLGSVVVHDTDTWVCAENISKPGAYT